ncbi:MAG: GAF domain-containing protein [Gammaproteobacteria bacterium]
MFRLPTKADLAHVLDAAVVVDDAIGGSIQLVAANGEKLRAIAVAGAAFRELPYDDETIAVEGGASYAQALVERRRIVIRDVATDDAFAPHREAAAKAGYRSVQSTPLLDSEFHALGVLSTYFEHPHHPGPASLDKIDVYCRIAALVIEVDDLHYSIVEADRYISSPPRALPASVADAAGSARRLLPTLAQPGHAEALHSAADRLEIVARYLRTLLHTRRKTGVLQLPD